MSSAATEPSTIPPKNTSAPSFGIQTRSKTTSQSLKRGIIGIYHHVSETHLHRYAAEFDFRYNHRVKLGYDDMQRTEIAAASIYGKRLTYRRPSDRPNV